LSPGLLGRAVTDVFRVRDPVGGYLALGSLEIQFAGAYEIVEFPLERIFHMGIPGRTAIAKTSAGELLATPPHTI
jgi:hypothetical protein